MSWPTNEPHPSAAPALTRRELRERERLTGGSHPTGEMDGLGALFGNEAQVAAAQAAAATQNSDAAQSAAPVLPPAPQPTPGATYFPSSAPVERAAESPFPFPAFGSSSVATSSARTAPGTPIATRQSTPSGPRRRRTIGSRIFSVAALLFAGTLVVGMSLPANAFYGASTALEPVAAASGKVSLQSVAVAANVQAVPTVRDKISVLSWAEVLKERYGTRDFAYTVGNGSIRWPFPYPVPISSGFGDRVAPCRGCSSHHMGIDFVPGNGSAIFVIADGVVIEHADDAYGFGNHVIIQHEINGHTVTSLYAHMQHGSSPLNVGDVVKVGDFVGLVGQTGMATGPHLHFEIDTDGVKVDPFAWLKANTN